MAKVVDCRGLSCPQPVIMTREALADGTTELSVLVDNPISKENVSRFLEKNGFSCSVTWSGTAGIFSIATAKNQAGDPADAQADAVAPAEKCKHRDSLKTLVLVTTETLGRGDDGLGAKLMKNFMATLPEMRDLWRVLFLNGGVKLTATPGETLDAIKELEASGVSVLVCGTCLAHYGLAEQKQVGETSNMLDIVTSLDLADKVICL